MPFGVVLKKLRLRNQMTQKQLADALGVSESRIGMYERCQREPDFEMLEAIADYFNVDMNYLTGRTDVERQYTFVPSAPAAISDEDLQFALFGGKVSEEAFAEVKRFAAFVAQQEKEKAK